MFRIGDFSRLARVSVKTLHHYDELGLLRPAQVDVENGYRYYRADQLTSLHRILTLKDLGFALQEIRQMMEDDSSTETEQILRRKIEEAQQMISHEEVRIARIESWLAYMEEDSMPEYDVLLKTLEPQLVASIRESSCELGGAFAELAGYIEAQGARQAGPGTIIYNDAEAGGCGEYAEAVFAISGPIAETERVKVYETPRVEQAACLVYEGTHADMGDASRYIAKWIEDNGYHITGPNRVVFLECEEGSDRAVVETQFPVEK
jgi:DNA-binding transcriptional MerR regulator